MAGVDSLGRRREGRCRWSLSRSIDSKAFLMRPVKARTMRQSRPRYSCSHSHCRIRIRQLQASVEMLA